MPDPHHPQDVPETPIAPFKLPDNPTTTPSTGIARTGQILGFLLKYRRAGVFAGLDGDLGEAPAVQSDSEAGPEAFVDDLEALGPTFIKLGQALSTRPDMLPPEYLVALERIQDDVSPMPRPCGTCAGLAALVTELRRRGLANRFRIATSMQGQTDCEGRKPLGQAPELS